MLYDESAITTTETHGNEALRRCIEEAESPDLEETVRGVLREELQRYSE